MRKSSENDSFLHFFRHCNCESRFISVHKVKSEKKGKSWHFLSTTMASTCNPSVLKQVSMLMRFVAFLQVARGFVNPTIDSEKKNAKMSSMSKCFVNPTIDSEITIRFLFALHMFHHSFLIYSLHPTICLEYTIKV